MALTGNNYRRLVARYVLATYGRRGLVVYEEVSLGTSIIGKQRRVDLLLVHPALNQAFALECKYQDSSGTADEKIPYALQDLTAMRIPGVIAYAGTGFSEGVLHLLQSSSQAAYCLPPEELHPVPRKQGDPIDHGTWQLDHVLAMSFGWWDIVVAGKKPLVL